MRWLQRLRLWLADYRDVYMSDAWLAQHRDGYRVEFHGPSWTWPLKRRL